MVDLRARIHGAGATRGVNLVVMEFDGRAVADADGAVTTHLLDAVVHPGDRRAPGETDLALVPSGEGDDAPSAGYSAEQFRAIAEAAGGNVTDLVDAAGVVVGRAYGVRADLLVSDGRLVVNTKTVAATELPVSPDAEGRDIRMQISASMAAAREARARRIAGSDEKAVGTDSHRIYQGTAAIL
ncbi:MAG: hypothetical protein J7484_05220 [Microbacterium sp.]|nr:hypothetical protein [Microbacterium sp.]